jgi:hypothetical protein
MMTRGRGYEKNEKKGMANRMLGRRGEGACNSRGASFLLSFFSRRKSWEMGRKDENEGVKKADTRIILALINI